MAFGKITAFFGIVFFLFFSSHTFAQNTGGTKVSGNPKSPSPTTNTLKGARIFKGRFSIPSKWPWMVFIKIERGRQCGGTLLSNEWVLTAAHCFDRFSATKIVIGSIYNDESADTNAVVRTVKQKCCHENYNHRTWENDICLIKLSSPVQYSSNIKQITLPEENTRVPDDTTCTVLGWGLTEDFKLHPGLQEAEVNVVNLQKCKSWYKEDSREIPDDHLCAGHEEGGSDTCGGDSGGPLVSREGNSYIMRGITSFGSTDCGSAKRPGVYTRVSSYISWIRRKMSQPCAEPAWSEWTKTCSVTCGSGREVRRRRCVDPEGNTVSNNRCPGQFVQHDTCTEAPCSEEKLYSWSPWKIECSVTCGRGIESRTRQCLDLDRKPVDASECGTGGSRVERRCARPLCPTEPEYRWGPWESRCSVTCGNGIETKVRNCLDEQNNIVSSSNCPGNSEVQETCILQPCQTYKWGPWKSDCSVTCGQGIELRTRECFDSNDKVVESSRCGSGSSTTQRSCIRPQCPAKPEYHWGAWKSECSVTCGNGVETKTRNCLNEENKVVSSSNCPGKNIEKESCNRPSCQSYKWGAWKVECSVTCGNGIETRSRKCLDSNDYVVDTSLCTSGTSRVQRKCTLERCRTEPEYRWSAWETWCTVTCGVGTEINRRNCLDDNDNIVSDFNCLGRSVEQGTCKQAACPKNNYWGPWKRECSVTCGIGVETLQRYCFDSSGKPAHPSRCKPGKDRKESRCYRPTCKQEYQWSAWEKLSCDVTCGHGQLMKYRTCQNNDDKMVESKYCDGNDFELEDCGLSDCPKPNTNKNAFHWGSWGSWSKCRSRGGCNGFRFATRFCYTGNEDVAPHYCTNTIGDENYREESCKLSYC
ncbi:A disintegrin and metalloproteinase with thrombospondin motifs 9-like [Styela clava]